MQIAVGAMRKRINAAMLVIKRTRGMMVMTVVKVMCVVHVGLSASRPTQFEECRLNARLPCSSGVSLRSPVRKGEPFRAYLPEQAQDLQARWRWAPPHAHFNHGILHGLRIGCVSCAEPYGPFAIAAVVAYAPVSTRTVHAPP